MSNSDDGTSQGTPPKQVANRKDEDFDEDEDEEDVQMGKQAVVAKRRNKDGSDDGAKERKQKLKKYGFGFCTVCLLILLIILLLLFLLPGDDGNSGRAEDFGNETSVPTFAPTIATEAPTELELTEAPTQEQTPAPVGTEPTPMPTAEPIGTSSPTLATPLSALSCEGIHEASQGGNHGEGNFGDYPFEGKYICSDTYGPDDAHPNRNVWAIQYGRRNCPETNYYEGFDICEQVGARRCSIAELAAEVGQGTGCGGDRQFIWSSTACNTNSGEQGVYMFDYGLRDSKKPFFNCETDLETLSVVRCCGDHY